MRILLLSGLRIFPNQSGGHLRTGSIAKSLARLGNEVCIYSLGGRREDYSLSPESFVQNIEDNLVEEVNLSLPVGILQTTFRRLGIPRVWQYLLLRTGFIPGALKERLDWAEAIFCDFPYTPPIPGSWRQKPWILISHNLEQKILEQGLRSERLFVPWMRRIEDFAPLRYDAILACAKEDHDYFRSRAQNPESVRLVANGVDPKVYRNSAAAGKALRESWGLRDEDWLIVFSGSRYTPNVEALNELKAFCAREAGFLTKNRIHFLILGSMELQAARTGSMIITGPVRETFAYFAAADAAINPVTRGSGSNVKIFEYLAAGLPVLSSSFGVRGTRLEEDVDYIPITDLKEALMELVQDHSKSVWKEMAALVWEKYRADCDMTEILRREWKALPSFERRASPIPQFVPSES